MPVSPQKGQIILVTNNYFRRFSRFEWVNAFTVKVSGWCDHKADAQIMRKEFRKRFEYKLHVAIKYTVEVSGWCDHKADAQNMRKEFRKRFKYKLHVAIKYIFLKISQFLSYDTNLPFYV